MSADQREQNAHAQVTRFTNGLDQAIAAAAQIGADSDSPLNPVYKQQFADAFAKLVWLRSAIKG